MLFHIIGGALPNGLHRILVCLFIEGAAGTVEDHISGDNKEESVKIPGFIHHCPFLPQTHEYLLDNLFLFVDIGDIQPGELKDFVPILKINLFEGLFVPVLEFYKVIVHHTGANIRKHF